MARNIFRIAGIFDTETTTIGKGAECVAFPIVYICNDLRDIDITEYTPDESDDIRFYRSSRDFVEWIESIVQEFEGTKTVPVICAYNLSFDIHSVMTLLNERYEMSALAQSRTGYYAIDLECEGKKVLRFWDTFYLEMGGLNAMGDTCGFAKAVGDWDYSLIRHKETPLTDKEKHYCRRDVQVIPAYLKWLLLANPHLKPKDLGCKVITKTSVVRLLGQRTIGKKKQNASSIFRNFQLLAGKENSPDFETYTLRKVAFRGGLTFTSGKKASQVFENVASFDVVSMHHLFINGRKVPVKFKKIEDRKAGNIVLDRVRQTTIEEILENYSRPFPFAFHIRFRAKNVRMKEGSLFDRLGIGILPASKFERLSEEEELEFAEDYRNILVENTSKVNGDKHKNGVFAFSKLVSADIIEVTLSELEYWCFEQVYDYDSIDFRRGEISSSFIYPPSYVTGMSNMLFEQKECMKHVLRDYREGQEYTGDVSRLPDSIAEGIREGRLDKRFLKNYYKSTIKGAFNSIYGIMAMDIYKPDYEIKNGEIDIIKSTLPNALNFLQRTPKNIKVLYTYGLRIVGGSRLHLILALLLIDKALGEKVTVLGGDTDSLKIALGECAPDDILDALTPLHDASREAIVDSQKVMREKHKEYASELTDIGIFEYEGVNPLHIELWNKGRISWNGENMKVTLAGVPRPRGMNLEKCLDAYAEKYTPREALEKAIGYNTILTPSVSRFLSVSRPATGTIFHDEVTDYLGNALTFTEFRAIALYENTKEIGSTLAKTNKENIDFLLKHGVTTDTIDKRFRYYKDTIYFSRGTKEEQL